MEPTTEQLERIAQYLDGQSVTLSQAELDFAAQMQSDEQRVGAALDCPMPAATAALLRRQARAAMVRPRLRLKLWLNAAAAAAAVLLVLSLVWPEPNRPAGNTNVTITETPAPATPPGNELASWVQDVDQGEHGMYELMSAMTLDNVDLELAIETAATASDPLTMVEIGG